MGTKTKIEWTDHTFNPWIGCSKVSPGCANCYAEELMDKRYGRAEWGPHGTRTRTASANWKQPLKWNRDALAAGVRRRVFSVSLGDIFEDRPEFTPWRQDLWELIAECTQLDWLLLTKRPENFARMLPWGDTNLFWSHVWLGVSAENQATADCRIPILQHTPAARRFVSYEPALELVNFRQFGSGIDGIIIGGESGRGARQFNPSWAMSAYRDCNAIGAKAFFKQMGANVVGMEFNDSKGGDWNEWPSRYQFRDMPESAVAT